MFHLKQFFRGLLRVPGLERVHVIAHSRGADLATTALGELFTAGMCASEQSARAVTASMEKVKRAVLAPARWLATVSQGERPT